MCADITITMLSLRLLKCVFDNAKKSLYKSFNAIFGKIGLFATSDVIMLQLKAKCLPILLHGLNACLSNATDYKSLDFIIFRTLKFLKLSPRIRTLHVFLLSFEDIYHNLTKINFLAHYFASENLLCTLFVPNAESEIKDLHPI